MLLPLSAGLPLFVRRALARGNFVEGTPFRLRKQARLLVGGVGASRRRRG